jgi:ribosomal protein S18 acetylase RimI-like enzyme
MKSLKSMKEIIINKTDKLVYRKGSGDTIEIYDIAVYSERCVGNGRALFNKLLEEVKEKRIFAITRKENFDAQMFYHKLGFEGYDLPNFYSDGNAMIFIYERS